MAADNVKTLTGAVVFSSIMGFLLDMGGYITYTLISPISFATGLGLLTAVVALANTPSLKGVAIAGFGAWVFIFFLNVEIPLPSPISELVYATLFVPIILGVGMMLLDYGKL